MRVYNKGQFIIYEASLMNIFPLIYYFDITTKWFLTAACMFYEESEGYQAYYVLFYSQFLSLLLHHWLPCMNIMMSRPLKHAKAFILFCLSSVKSRASSRKIGKALTHLGPPRASSCNQPLMALHKDFSPLHLLELLTLNMSRLNGLTSALWVRRASALQDHFKRTNGVLHVKPLFSFKWGRSPEKRNEEYKSLLRSVVFHVKLNSLQYICVFALKGSQLEQRHPPPTPISYLHLSRKKRTLHCLIQAIIEQN